MSMTSFYSTEKRLTSMQQRFVVFSVVLFLLILTAGTWTFFISMSQMVKRDIDNELYKIVGFERLKLEALINSEIAIVLQMAKSPVIVNYFSNPSDTLQKELAFREIAAYRRSLKSNTAFWVNDRDKKFYINDAPPYLVNPDDTANYWYNMTLYETETYNFNINYNPDLQKIMLWINAPVFDAEERAVGMLGTGIHLSDFVSSIYDGYKSRAELYFVNSLGEITGARDAEIIAKKIKIEDKLPGIGAEIFAKIKDFKGDKTIFFGNMSEEVAVSPLGVLNWYIVAIMPQVIGEYGSLITILFAVVMFAILLIFIIFNIFVSKLLQPLKKMTQLLHSDSSDWNCSSHLTQRTDEIGAILRSFGAIHSKNRELTENIYRDTLTGVYSRRFLENNLERNIKSLSRSGGMLSLMFVDVDFFKNYNDTYGHGKGDECLKLVAQTLVESLQRADDFVARYGGEEFIVVLPNTDQSGAIFVAETLLENIIKKNIPHEKNEAAPCITISIGITTGEAKHTHKKEDYITKADKALYKSKQNGRNQYTFEAFAD